MKKYSGILFAVMIMMLSARKMIDMNMAEVLRSPLTQAEQQVLELVSLSSRVFHYSLVFTIIYSVSG